MALSYHHNHYFLAATLDVFNYITNCSIRVTALLEYLDCTLVARSWFLRYNSMVTNTVSIEEQQATSARVSAVSVKLQPADPHLWFAQVEAQFAIKGVSAQKTKFDYVVSSLSPEFATEVCNLLIHLPNDDPYDALKLNPVDQAHCHHRPAKATTTSQYQRVGRPKTHAITLSDPTTGRGYSWPGGWSSPS